MAKEPTGAGRKGRTLSSEEEDLWARVAETAEPLAPSRRPATSHNRPQGSSKPQQSAARKTPPRPASQSAQAPKPARQVSASQASSFARRESRQIRSGRTEIDARLDLHGMRQQEAHGALRAFLVRAHSAGYRYVLVITGKGGGARDEEEPESFYEERDRGVLKRQVPQWLAEPAMRNLVVSYQTAHQHHGGEGALYVRIRRANKPSG